jgi:hypothetical protein
MKSLENITNKLTNMYKSMVEKPQKALMLGLGAGLIATGIGCAKEIESEYASNFPKEVETNVEVKTGNYRETGPAYEQEFEEITKEKPITAEIKISGGHLIDKLNEKDQERIYDLSLRFVEIANYLSHGSVELANYNDYQEEIKEILEERDEIFSNSEQGIASFWKYTHSGNYNEPNNISFKYVKQ